MLCRELHGKLAVLYETTQMASTLSPPAEVRNHLNIRICFLMKLFLGIDGGQTSTKSILADETAKVLGTGLGGPCSHFKDESSREQAREAFYVSVHEAFAQAGLADSLEVESAFWGITGVAGPEAPAAKTYREILGERLKSRVVGIDHDARTALAGAIPSMIGVIVIAGTGSIAFGMNDKGESARAGGWGYLLGDQGSAYEIGRQALTAVAREQDGLGPETALTALILESFNVQDAALLPQVLYRDPKPKLRIAGVSSLATRAAQAGDPIAQTLFAKGGAGLAELTGAVIRKLKLEDRPVTVSGTGGVFQAGELIWKPFGEQVRSQHPGATVIPPRFPPFIGALLMAYRQGGLHISAHLLQRLAGQIKG
jgi:N-acetylglucosamine kinase-like BadF-type ATPase